MPTMPTMPRGNVGGEGEGGGGGRGKGTDGGGGRGGELGGEIGGGTKHAQASVERLHVPSSGASHGSDELEHACVWFSCASCRRSRSASAS